ncbi:MAG: hypothetical protein JNM06_16970 [Blastocatellia bacterium]|nr:hypothetical protein [Blastocatellia bacterium]MBN8725554.1 hypothetical protein [Acidobacteriota bacterium]
MSLKTLKMKLMTTFYRRVLCYRRSFAVSQPIKFDLSIKFTLLTKEHLPLLENCLSAKEIANTKKSWERGHDCFALILSENAQEKIVSFGWVATKNPFIDYLNCFVKLDDKTAYFYNHYTFPDYRKSGFHFQRVLATQYYYQELGFRHSFSVVAWENSEALQAADKFGKDAIGVYHYWRLGIKNLYKAESWTSEPLPELIKP